MATQAQIAAQLAALASARAAFNDVVVPQINAAGAVLQAAQVGTALSGPIAAFNAAATGLNGIGVPFRKALTDLQAQVVIAPPPVPEPPPPPPPPPPPVPVPVATTLVLPPVLSLSVGVPQSLAAYATSDKPLAWSGAPADAVSVSPTGVVTLLVPGEYQVTITVDDGQ